MTRYEWDRNGIRLAVQRGPGGEPMLCKGDGAYGPRMLTPGEVAFLMEELLILAEKWQAAEERAARAGAIAQMFREAKGAQEL